MDFLEILRKVQIYANVERDISALFLKKIFFLAEFRLKRKNEENF